MRPPFLSLFMLFVLLFLITIAPGAVVSSSKPPPTGFLVIHNLRNYLQLDLSNVTGPESIEFDCYGRGPYVGVSDGTILKWHGSHLGWKEFAFTSPYRSRYLCDGSTNTTNEPICGRPLGLKFHPTTCDLYIADAYFGLLKTGPNGGMAQKLADSVGGVPFRFLNALDINSQTGMVYFTDTSTIYQRREWPLSIRSGDKTGRLLQYNPYTKEVIVLLYGLGFANGVALSKDNSFVLVAESATSKILRFWLQGSKTYTLELFSKLERPPDNIKRNYKGEFWVALNSRRGIKDLPQTSVVPWLTNDPVAIKFDEHGKVLKVLDGNEGTKLQSISDVEEHNGWLWIGSVVNSYLGVLKF